MLGGDHSSPLGLIQASARRHPGLGILHIDAHADLRSAYMGFAGSHASIMRNVLAIKDVGRLVGVGYRDIGDEEGDLLRSGAPRLVPFFDQLLASRMANGDRWTDICAEIVDALPEQVHLSMDIDGLDPSLCPATGTPVPGGLGFHQLGLLLETLSRRRRVVSFDLCEVVPGVPIVGKADGWDAIVGARVLYKLIGCAVRSQEGWLERGGAKVGSVWL